MEQLQRFVSCILERAEAARAELAGRPTLARHIETSLAIPRPFLGGEDIRLVVLGQDPTIKNEARRARVKTVLNLDQSGALRQYIGQIADGLGWGLENVYATNVCKHFFRRRPTDIAVEEACDVLRECAERVVPILEEELRQFPGAVVISLGEPVLSVLARGDSRRVRDYWGYPDARRAIACIDPGNSSVGRAIYPMPHQPSLRKKFYKENLGWFLESLRSRYSTPLTGKNTPEKVSCTSTSSTATGRRASSGS